MSNGELGLPYNEVGQVVQALGRCIVEREIEGIGEEQVIGYLKSTCFNEDRLWEHELGPIIDRLEGGISDWVQEQKIHQLDRVHVEDDLTTVTMICACSAGYSTIEGWNEHLAASRD